MRGLRLGLSLTGGAAFNPASLFASGEQGGWWDPSDLSTMSQNSDGTGTATVGQPVGRILDKSGRGNHLIQAATASKPILRQSGALYWLEFDGVDDFLEDQIAGVAQPFDRVSTIRQTTFNSGHIFGNPITGGTDNAGVLYQISSGNVAVFDGTGGPSAALALATIGTVTERHDNLNSRIAVNNGAYASAASGTGGIQGFAVGRGLGGTHANIDWYGTVERFVAFSDAEIASLRTYQGAKGGLVL